MEPFGTIIAATELGSMLGGAIADLVEKSVKKGAAIGAVVGATAGICICGCRYRKTCSGKCRLLNRTDTSINQTKTR